MYDGLEIDMLSLGNADSIVITRWFSGQPVRVLVDGGNAGSYEKVKTFLVGLGITRLDHVVCTHPHNDHAAGLIKLIDDTDLFFGHAWLHQPRLHIDQQTVTKALSESSPTSELVKLKESVITTDELVSALQRRGIMISEPFAGMTIDFMQVVGPTVEFYEQLIANMADVFLVEKLAEADRAYEVDDWLEFSAGQPSTGLLPSPATSPENESSVIMTATYGTGTHLLTADAGCAALNDVISRCYLSNCHWMQIPHHGSRRNVTQELIDHFSPSVAFVSAEGSRKHPRRAVVNAFKRTGAWVYSTHYPAAGHLWHHQGTVPLRSDYGSATTLWDAKT